ncbi:MAG: hypothetical protein ACXV9S_03860 [Acidimicrobiia bacterium]
MPAITRPSRRDLFHPDRFARLHRVVELLAGSPRPADGFLDPDHFLLLSWCRPDRPVGIEIYRHVHTRGYLNLDADGTAYRYGAPRPDDPDRVGTYTRHRTCARPSTSSRSGSSRGWSPISRRSPTDDRGRSASSCTTA